MNKPLLDELLRLDPVERLDIAVKLWESVHPPGSALPGEPVELTEEQMAEIDRRLSKLERDPSRGAPWEEVFERIRARFGQ